MFKNFLMASAVCFVSFSVGMAFASSSSPLYYYHTQGEQFTLKRTLEIEDLTICDPATGIVCDNLVSKEREVDVRCTGGGSAGGWIFLEESVPEEDQACFESMDVCDLNGFCIKWDGTNYLGEVPTGVEVNFAPWTTGSAFSRCDDSLTHVGDGEYKEHCIWDSESHANSSPLSKRVDGVDDPASLETGITGYTHDDMFRFPYDAAGLKSAYIEYLDIEENDEDRLQYITRDSSVASEKLAAMVPAGPRDTYKDYRDFLANPPKGFSAVDACYPVKARLGCENVSLPVVDGSCGSEAALELAAADLTNISNGTSSALCSKGFPVNVNDSASPYVTWDCAGISGGSKSSCSHEFVLDATCGSAHEQYFVDSAALNANGSFCGTGSNVSGLIDGDGPWSWKCVPQSSAGLPINCVAFKDGDACDAFYENDTMVFVQDLSSSFGDDIGNTVKALKSLFNNSLFSEWEVGLTSTHGSDGQSSVYHKELGWTAITPDKQKIINKVQSYKVSSSEDPLYAIQRAIEDFYPRADGKTGTIVMITDEADTNRSYLMPDIEELLRDNDLSLIILATNNVIGWYENLINKYEMSDIATLKTITSSSDDLAESLVEGLVDLGCESVEEESETVE